MTYLIISILLITTIFFLVFIVKIKGGYILTKDYSISQIVYNDVFILTINEKGFKPQKFYIDYFYYDLFIKKPLISVSYIIVPIVKVYIITDISIDDEKIV